MSIEKNLSEIITLISKGVKTGIEQLENGFQYTDIFAFVPVLSSIPEAIKDADHALHYLKDMTEEKETEIIDAVVAEIGDSPRARQIATRLLHALIGVYLLYKTFSDSAAPTGATAGRG